MRHFVVAALLLLLATGAGANPWVVDRPAVALTGDEEIELPDQLIGFTPGNELDEIIGDTLILGSSAWDAQHNSKVARQIAFLPGEDNWQTHIIWTKLFGLTTTAPRHVVYTSVTSDGAGGFEIDPLPASQVENEYRAGYCTLSFDPADNAPLPGMHVSYNAGDDYVSTGSIENPFIPLLFNLYDVPAVFNLPHIWPHATYGATGHLHMISHEQREGNADPMALSYYRWEVDVANGDLIPATQDGDPIEITDIGMNIAGDVVTNDDGTQVAVGITMARYYTIGELWGGVEDVQWNNDVWVYLSEDAGLTWDLDNPVDATQFIGPQGGSPGDTMRAYADCSVIFDDEDNLHVAFTAAGGNAIDGTALFTSRLYHYMQDDDGNDWWTLIGHQQWPGYASEAWGRTTDRPSLYYDDDTGILWCLFRSFPGGENDYGSGSGLGNGDVMISASPPGMYNGLLWTEPVNITNTNWTSPGGAPAGECASEMCPSLALDNAGEYLHITYLVDLDAGVGISSVPEGTITDNPIVYHRVAKQELLDEFEANGAWLVNFPMHHDSTGFWQDPGNWEWDEYGGFFTGNREPVPVTLDLEPINGTVPPGGGVVTYSATVESFIPTPVPNVTYWTTVLTPGGDELGPLMSQTFTIPPNADVTVSPIPQQVPGWAPGGMYLYTGHLGFYPMSVVEDSFYIWKLGGASNAGGYDDWSGTLPEFFAGEETGQVSALPSEYELSGAYPNPFNPATTVSVSLPETAELAVTVHNINGRLVATLVDGVFEAGEHSLTFDATGLASGIYFIQAEVPGEFTAIRKATLMK
ncbi:MAG: hypothetical protein MAG453_00103 [Calditrichaeota bacterium]|nr:hypothetical protein [Calditrichota bacterium]